MVYNKIQTVANTVVYRTVDGVKEIDYFATGSIINGLTFAEACAGLGAA